MDAAFFLDCLSLWFGVNVEESLGASWNSLRAGARRFARLMLFYYCGVFPPSLDSPQSVRVSSDRLRVEINFGRLRDAGAGCVSFVCLGGWRGLVQICWP